jgi:hypothetical protein
MEKSYASFFPVQMKVIYVKMLFLIDSNRFKPLFYRTFRGANKREAIYDSSIHYQYIRFNTKQGEYQLKYKAEPGFVDDVILVHPSSLEGTKQDDPFFKNVGQAYQMPISPSIDNTAIAVAHFYNSYQKEAEWTDAVANQDNTKEIKLMVDFSSIIAVSDKRGNEKPLFKDVPTAYLLDEKGNKKEQIKKFEDIKAKFFSVTHKDVQRWQSIRLEWYIDWDKLTTSKTIPGKNVFARYLGEKPS